MNKPNSTIVRRINFDQQLMQQRTTVNGEVDQDHINYVKSKVEKYRFNDLKIDFSNLVVNDLTLKKSPVIRIEVALRDNYGVVYDTVYKTITDEKYTFS